MVEERYTPVKELGTGGMGAVWLYQDTLLNRPVAVKFLQATDEQMYKDLFLSEARTLASLQHPNITMIYDAAFNEADNRFYIMMEYVEGNTLADVIEQSAGPLPLETVLDIMTGVLEALKYAHNKGLVHRDIKPENIVIQKDRVKLTDFGLAALVSILAEGDNEYILGTPAYMPPEQIISEGVDGRSDLYALGVTLFELLADGRLPFAYEDKRQLLQAHIEETPPSVREYAPAIPLILDHMVAKLLAKHPDDRYPSAEAVLDVFKSLRARQMFSRRYLQLFDPEAGPLVGRRAESKKLNDTWAAIQKSGKPRLLAITGELGMGKTHLVAEFLGCQVIDKNLTALAGRCNELGAPYAPYAEVLATIFDSGLVNPNAFQSQMDHILKQMPGLAALLNIDPPPQPVQKKPKASSSGLWQTLSTRVPSENLVDPMQAQWQLFATVLNIMAELGPTVIFLDDAEFMDESSIALTRFLIQQGQLPLLLLVECQGDEKPAAWLTSFDAAEKEDIHLSALTLAEIKDYLATRLEGQVSDAAVSIIQKRSRGNPLHIEELTRQLIDSGELFKDENSGWRYLPPPDTGDLSQDLLSPFLMNAFTRRLEKLSLKNRELLAVAAVLEHGSEFEFEMWVALLGGQPQRTVAQDALKEALGLRLLRDMGDNHYSFRPVDVSNALAAGLPAARQQELHRQAAKILVEQESDPILIGYHFEQAGQATESARYLESAGARAMAANAVNQAISCYTRAMQIIETEAGYSALGKLYRQQGAWSDSINAHKQALELAKKNADINRQAHILNELAFTLWLSDNYREAAQSASAVLKLSGVSDIEYAAAQSHLGMISWVLGHLAEAEKWCRKSVETLSKADDEIKLAAAYSRLGLVYFSLGNYPEAIRVTNRSLESRKKQQDHWGQGYCLVTLSKVAVDRGDFQQATAFLDSAKTLFEKISSSDGLMVVYTEQGRTLLAGGQIQESLTALSRAMRLAEQLGKQSAYGLGDIYLLIARANLAQNKLNQAKESVESALKLVETAGNQEYIAAGWAISAQILMAQANLDAAAKMYQKSIELYKKIGSPAGLLRAKLNYARLLAVQNRHDQAATLEQQAQSEAEKIDLRL